MPDTCYFCGKTATSNEHVPPACLFPEKKDLDDGVDYRKNLITVRSCDEHNTEKSNDDEYIRLIFVHGYFSNKAGRDHFHSKVVRAMTRRPALLSALYGKNAPVTVDGEQTVAVTVDRVRFDAALKQIVQGLCLKFFGERWTKEVQIHSPILLSIGEPVSDEINTLVKNLCKSIIECLSGIEIRGDNPDIFWCQILIDKAKDRLLCRMVFYGGFEVFAISDLHLRDKHA